MYPLNENVLRHRRGKKNSSRVSWSEEEKKLNCPWATLQTKTEETKKENPWAKYKKVAAESMEKSESVKPISDKKETNPSNNSERRPWQGRCHDEQGLSMEPDLATMLRHRRCRASDPPLACSTCQWWPSVESRNLPAIRSPAATGSIVQIAALLLQSASWDIERWIATTTIRQ